MSFAVGLIVGVVVGGTIMHFVHEYIDSMIEDDDDNRWLGRTCPPCDGKCKQGRDCPAEVKPLFTNDIHTCHDDCQKPACVQARRARGQS